MEIKEGRTYRAKRVGNASGYVNDRTVLYIGAYEVQYDGPMVRLGGKYRRCTKEEFLAWASHDVTDQLPEGDYQSYVDYLKSKKVLT